MPFGQMMFELQKIMPNFLEWPEEQSEKKKYQFYRDGHSWSIALYHAGNTIRSFEKSTVIHSFLFYRILFQFFFLKLRDRN